MKDAKGNLFNPSPGHYQMVSKFLTGETSVPASQILEAWLKSPYGLPHEDDKERQLLYSTEVDYRCIKHARPAMTSFAAQLIQEKLVREARRAVQKDGGLHTFTLKGKEISRYDLGAQAFPESMERLQESMPLACRYLLMIATPHKTTGNRDRRPPEVVRVTFILKKLACKFTIQTGCNSCTQLTCVLSKHVCKAPAAREGYSQLCLLHQPLHLQV